MRFYDQSIAVLIQNLNNLSAILDKGLADAKARGIDESVFLSARLAPDMLHFTKQIQIATDMAKNGAARLAGVQPPVFADNETTGKQLSKRIKNAVKFLRSLKPAQLEDAATRNIEMTLPIGTLHLNGHEMLYGWTLPNVFFHISTAYNILRHNGVALGKGDFLGAALAGRIVPNAGKKAVKAAKTDKKTDKKSGKKASKKNA